MSESQAFGLNTVQVLFVKKQPKPLLKCINA